LTINVIAGHVAADRVAGDRDPGCVQAVGGAVVGDPRQHGVDFLDRGGVVRLRGEAVVGEHERGAGTVRELADEPVVGVGVAEHPSGAVGVEDDRGFAVGALGAHDAD
jgi:hypothetical protein